MKKIAIATLLALVAISASAVEVGVEYQDQDGKNGNSNINAYQLKVKQDINQNFAVDAKTIQNIRDANASNGGGVSSSQLEIGATGKYNLGYVSPYVRAGLGQRFITTENYGYYSIEPGVTVPVSTTGLTVGLGWRFQAPFSTSEQFTTRTWRGTVGYDVTNSDNVYVGYDSERGDLQYNIVRVGYAHKF